jgi:hypothetical protein
MLIPIKCEKILPCFIFLPKNMIQQTLITEWYKVRLSNAFGRTGHQIYQWALSIVMVFELLPALKAGRRKHVTSVIQKHAEPSRIGYYAVMKW